MNFRNNDYIVPKKRLLTYRFLSIFFLICLTNLNCLGAKFANSLIKFRQESESYSSCIRVSDLKPFKILRLRFAKNCRKMYPGAKRTCSERMKCFTFCPCNCGCWNYFVHKEPWPCSRKKLRINQFGLWEWIFSAFLHVGGLLVPIVVFKFECYSFLNEIVSSKSQVNGFLTFPCLEN